MSIVVLKFRIAIILNYTNENPTVLLLWCGDFFRINIRIGNERIHFKLAIVIPASDS